MKQSKKRKASKIYLVKYTALDVAHKTHNFLEVFFNKAIAISCAKRNCGTLTEWSNGKHIVMPKRRGKK